MPGLILFEQLSIKGAELDGFKDLVAGDVLFPCEIRQGAGDFQDAVVGAGGEVHLLHGVFEIAAGFGVELAALAHLLRAHGGVGGDLG